MAGVVPRQGRLLSISVLGGRVTRGVVEGETRRKEGERTKRDSLGLSDTGAALNADEVSVGMFAMSYM